MNTNYPENCWYVAATCDEVRDSPLGRRVLGTDVVLWRGASGGVNAFEDRCAHRAFPLSHSSVEGDRLVCGYHGCTYDTGGRCVYTPVQPLVPTDMHVGVFPVVEEAPFIWIWMGRPGAAAAHQPPALRWINEPGWETFASAWKVEANYLMIHEHYLDFSYAPVLHKRDLPPGLTSMGAFNEVEVTETTVSYTRLLPELPLAGWQANATGLDPAGPYKHREGGEFVSPAMHRQYWEIETSAGEKYITTRAHAITPETGASSHVFMQVSRNYATDRDAVTEGLRAFLDGVQERDTSTLEIASKHAGYDGWRGGVEFQADAAALHARRIVRVMLAKEAGPYSVGPRPSPDSGNDSASSSPASAAPEIRRFKPARRRR